MSEGLSWILPAVKEAYENREEIAKLWEKVAALVFGREKSIALTGVPGAGKTVLFDHLTGAAFKAGYSPPGKSRAVEVGKIHRQGKRISFSVVPGQVSAPRLDATDDLFDDNAVDGVVHVVPNGFVDLRSTLAREVLAANNLADFRAAQISQELVDLDHTCELIRKSIRSNQKPRWMLVVVDKVDLYYESISQAQSYYSPGSGSPFANRMDLLCSQVGSDNFEWEAVPACAWLEDFKWNNEIAISRLKPSERDFYIAQLLRTIGAYCGR